MASTFKSKAVKGAAIEASVLLKLNPIFAYLNYHNTYFKAPQSFAPSPTIATRLPNF
jgi:hypothetical protein